MEAPAVSAVRHQRQRAGVRGLAVPVPLHHDRVRRAVGFPLADLLGHHAEAAGEGKPDAADRLRRHAHRVVRRDHGADHRRDPQPAPVLRDQRTRRRRPAPPRRRPPTTSTASACPARRSPARQITAAAESVGEKSIVSRTGGAPTLAFGMSEVLHQVFGGTALEGVLVPLRDHVRGVVHPHHRRRRHPGRPVHALRRAEQSRRAAPQAAGSELAGRRVDLQRRSWSRRGAASC